MVLNVVFPPWVLPGSGIVAIAIARVVAVEMAARSAGEGRAGLEPSDQHNRTEPCLLVG